MESPERSRAFVRWREDLERIAGTEAETKAMLTAQDLPHKKNRLFYGRHFLYSMFLQPAPHPGFACCGIVFQSSSSAFYIYTMANGCSNHQRHKQKYQWRYAHKADPFATKHIPHGAF